MNGLEQRVTRLHLVPVEQPIFHEGGYSVEIDDEASGEFIVVRSQNIGDSRVTIDARDWPALRAAIDRMVAECRA